MYMQDAQIWRGNVCFVATQRSESYKRCRDVVDATYTLHRCGNVDNVKTEPVPGFGCSNVALTSPSIVSTSLHKRSTYSFCYVVGTHLLLVRMRTFRRCHDVAGNVAPLQVQHCDDGLCYVGVILKYALVRDPGSVCLKHAIEYPMHNDDNALFPKYRVMILIVCNNSTRNGVQYSPCKSASMLKVRYTFRKSQYL